MTTKLTGATEVPGPGDADASGKVGVNLDARKGQVCVGISVVDAAPLTAAHIHFAPAGVAGPVVVSFTPLIVPGGKSVAGCVGGVAPALVQNIISHPDQYYVNVHNAPYPAGAARGQLA